MGNRADLASGLEHLAGLAAAQAQPERALRLAGAAAALRDAIGAPLPSAQQNELMGRLAAARGALRDDEAAAWASGQVMLPEEAVDYALAGDAEPIDRGIDLRSGASGVAAVRVRDPRPSSRPA
jgi:hypothetical protein